jgi:DNA repair protein RecO
VANLIKSEALILRRFRHGDTSLVLHAFTRMNGRVAFIAKGARSGGRKPPVPLVPAVLLEFIWKPSTRSDLQLLREWSLVDGFGAIHRDFEKLAWTQAGLEVLSRTLRGEQEHESLFELALGYISAVGQASGRYELLLLRFRLAVLRELGFEIDLTVPENMTSRGWYRPGEARLSPESSSRLGVPVSLGAWKTFSALARTGFEEVHRIKPAKEALAEMNAVLDAAYLHAFEKWGPLESLKLLNPIQGLNR